MLRDLQACYGDIKWRNACVHAKALLSTFEDSLEEICDWGRCQLLPSKLMHYRADSRSESIHYVLRQGWMCDRTPHYADELCHNVLLPFLESSIKRFVAMASDRLVRFVLKKTGQIDGDSSSSRSMIGPSNVPPAWLRVQPVRQPRHQTPNAQHVPQLEEGDVSGWKFRCVTQQRFSNR